MPSTAKVSAGRGYPCLGVIGGRLKDFTVPPAPAGSLDATLAATGIPLFALDLRAELKTGLVAERLQAPRPGFHQWYPLEDNGLDRQLCGISDPRLE